MKKILLAIAITLLVSPVTYARYRAGGYANEGHYERQRSSSSYQRPATRRYYPSSGRRYYSQQPRSYQEPAVTVAPQRFFKD